MHPNRSSYRGRTGRNAQNPQRDPQEGIVTKSPYYDAHKRGSRHVGGERAMHGAMVASGSADRPHPSVRLIPETPPNGHFYVSRGELRAVGVDDQPEQVPSDDDSLYTDPPSGREDEVRSRPLHIDSSGGEDEGQRPSGNRKFGPGVIEQTSRSRNKASTSGTSSLGTSRLQFASKSSRRPREEARALSPTLGAASAADPAVPLGTGTFALKSGTNHARTSRPQVASKGLRARPGAGSSSSSEANTRNNSVIREAIATAPTIEDEESENEEDIKKDIIIISSDSEPSSSSEEDDTRELVAALGALSVPVRLQQAGALPFLARNVRRTFTQHCRSKGIATSPKTTPDPVLRVAYKFLNEDDEWEEYDGSTSDWRCPLCDVHGILNTREMLDYHVRKDHAEVQAFWAMSPAKVHSTAWSLTIQWTSADRDRASIYALEVKADITGGTTTVPTVAEEQQTQLDLPFSQIAIETSTPATPGLPRTKHEQEEQPSLKELQDLRFDRNILAALSRGNEPRVPRRTGLAEDGQLVPPPKDARWGPASEPPTYSSRPGGPRIYDLLKELPLEPFGVLAWSIVDREEDFFEQEDVSDEEKSMFALWNRWIMLNRVQFVFQKRPKQFTNFLDEYYVMIHRAAGWKALRSLLLTLMANKFLNVAQVSQALKHYEKLVGMSTWYTQ